MHDSAASPSPAFSHSVHAVGMGGQATEATAPLKMGFPVRLHACLRRGAAVAVSGLADRCKSVMSCIGIGSLASCYESLFHPCVLAMCGNSPILLALLIAFATFL